MACAREANEFPAKAFAISMVFFIVNCGLKVGNSFLYIFSRFLSFTEILHTFDFLCLRFFYSLTDLFLCASETKKKQQQQGGFLFFQTTRKHLWNVVNTNWLPRRKLHLSQEKSVRRKTLDIQDQNAVNDSVKSQYNFNNSMCSVHQAVKKYLHLTISLFTHQCITIALHNISCRMFLRILLRKGIFLH